MKRIICLVFIAFFISHTAKAQVEGFGLGLIFGDPTGLSMKYFVDEKNAIDGAVAWSFWGEFFYVHADYLWHFDVIDVSSGSLPFYVGVGPKLGFSNDFRMGARIPLGITYLFDTVPIDLFIEIAPGMNFTPATQGDFDAGLGARFYFGR